MKKLASALVFVFGAAMSFNAQAETANAWSDCGVGGLLGGAAFEKGSPPSKITAVIVNVIWDLGTTAVTSMTASPDTCGNVAGEAAAFVGENYDQLAKQTAQGEGEHLSALMSIAGCDATAASSAVSTLRGEMAQQVTAEGYAQKTRGEKAAMYYQAVMSSTGQCQA